MTSLAALVAARAGDPNPALRLDDEVWSYQQYVAGAAQRAALVAAERRPGAPHVGVLLENVPEFALWYAAAALGGFTIVGLNPTRRGDELARDITFTECQFVVTDAAGAELLAGLDLEVTPDRVMVIGTEAYTAALAPHADAPLPAELPDPATQHALVFTSGTSGNPKAVIYSQGRLHMSGTMLAMMLELGPDDVTYCAMPLFHSNAIITAWVASLANGSTLAMRRRFSASQFLPDVRRYGATYFNYVGKPLAYVLATPELPDDADNPLRRAFGNEGAEADIARFTARFACPVIDGYGSSEGGVSISRTPDSPPGSLGRAAETVCILHAETGEECDRARFDDNGRLLNADAAVGEIANRAKTMFEGYWNNPEADRERAHDGTYWSGDLGYRDEAGFFYFAGRSSDWLRVDGENLAAAPLERIFKRFPGVAVAAVYGVPDPEVGDRLMLAVGLEEGATFDPVAFDAFLADQPDLHAKGRPSFIRAEATLPMTETNKVLKRLLQRERWDAPATLVDDLTSQGRSYRPMTASDRTALVNRFTERGRGTLLDL